MDLKSIRVEDFIDMIPSVDTLLPMLKSFAGKIDSQIAFSTKMDSQLNMDPLSMQGSLRIKGDSLVLMDGETFAKKKKKARFKNRDRYLVDSVSVEALIHDGFIELFPFLMTMDRYCAAISGRQNIDMSYKYHISVLKSIIPFRFGINIRGDGEKMKFGITVSRSMTQSTRSSRRAHACGVRQCPTGMWWSRRWRGLARTAGACHAW